MCASPDSARIFLITHEFFPKRGGIAVFSEEIARASAQLGFDVEVWAQSLEASDERAWPFRVRRLPLKGTHDLTCQLRLARQLIRERRRLRHSIVYLTEPGPILAMMLLQFWPSFRPRNLVLTFHGSEIRRFARTPWTRFLGARLIRHATRISTLSRYTQELLFAHFPEARSKTLLTPGALRADFAVVPAGRSASASRLVVLTVGRLHPRKGQLITLRALQSLAPEFRHRIEYWIVGSHPRKAYEQQLREVARSADFPVKLLGDVPDVELSQVYDRADIFALTSIEHGPSVEGFGLVYLEASAHGLPIVAHHVGGVPEAVTDGVTGLLVPPERPAQLAAAFEKLITDPVLRRELGDRGRDWARRNCWRESAQALFQIPPVAA